MVRVSFGIYNDECDVIALLKAVKALVLNKQYLVNNFADKVTAPQLAEKPFDRG
jgi:hypothetical protein